MLIIYATIVVATLIIAIRVIQSMGVQLPILSTDDDSKVGQPVDSLNGVMVYYNGNISHVANRTTAPDGYNIGLKWQCVEFVKRYYYEYLHFEMTDSYGNAKDFYDLHLPDASFNVQRGLVQYANPSLKKPAVNDIIVFDGHIGNKYGHIAIISKVYDDKIEIIQQNPGPGEPSREEINMIVENGRWKVMQKRALGWLRIE